jgi:Na+-transporting NADH:ubiquinone oxidoreductase subunit F
MRRWMRRLHKWFGLLIGLQFVLWMASGLVMSVLDTDKVHGRQWRVNAAAPLAWPATAMPVNAVLAASGAPVHTVASAWLLDLPVYQLSNNSASWLVRAGDGKPVVVDASLAQQLAQASYRGSAHAGPAQRLDKSLETRAHKGAVWRVDFADPDETSVYVSAQTGAVLEHRNRSWRLFDLFWMLHIMDYSERSNFNNPLLVAMSVAGLWLSLTGAWLLVASFRVTLRAK